MRTSLGILTLALAFAAPAFASEQKSNQIAKAVAGMKSLAASGVSVKRVAVSKTGSVKEALTALSIKEGYTAKDEEISWVGSDNSAWEADSTNFGETTMRGAYAYIFEKEDGEADLDPAEKAKLARNRAKAAEAFKLLLGTGVKFGVAPMGAVQCGVTFAALAIIDPHTGKIYLFAKEGSGC